MAISTRTGGQTRTQTALADINITPLVDVVLVLLIIFMLTAPVLQSGIDVAVPHTRSVNQLTEQRTVVTIDKSQNVFLQSSSRNGGSDTPINLDNLTAQLRSIGGRDPASRTIYVRADERVPFGAFASVMDAVKRAGITNISIVTQPLESKSSDEAVAK
jgi:biopolymer transport protein ExbD/biopolymer transport protein TolR